MKDKKYSKDHEWVSVDSDIATIGITDFAQKQLGDIVFIEMPDIGAKLERVRLARNGKIYKLGLSYKGGNVQYRNLYKDDDKLSIEGRCIVKEPTKMDIQWTV